MSKRVVVIGGGASGLMCAYELAKGGAQVTVLERNDRVGKKLLCTGNGKCNLTNMDASAKAYNSAFVENALSKYTPQEIVSRFKAMGLLVRIDAEGRVYPYCESATAVLNVFLQRLREVGAQIVCDCEVGEIVRCGKEYKVRSSNGEYLCDCAVLATGSDATQGKNSHFLAEKLGHRTTEIKYAISPLLCKEVRGANGVRAKVSASIFINGEIAMQERGEVLFKDGALSGVLIFRLSSMLARYRGEVKNCNVVLDLVPDMSQEELENHIYENCSVFAPLEGVLHKAIAHGVYARTPMDRSLIMSRKKARDIARVCKEFNVEVTALSGRSSAQAASGGISTDGIDAETMRSRICDGLYIIGEVADVDGLCGGYNLHWAWASALACSEDILC